MKSTSRSLAPVVSVIGGIAAALFAGFPLAEAGEITPIARWGGQVGKIGGGGSGYFCSQVDLDAFWSKWDISRPKPEVEFDRQLAVFYMGSGGPHLMRLLFEEGGNLVAEFVEAPTFSRQPNYLIFTVARQEIRSLNGTPVTCPE